MFPRKYKKISKIKRFILKLLDVYALDKETLNLVNPDYQNVNCNNFTLNEQSIILSKGYLNLDRKITQLDICYRYAPNNQLWNSTERWKRIIPNINKKQLILTSLISLNESILNFLKKHKLNITLNLISDISDKAFDNEILKYLDNKNININFIKSKIKGNRGSYLECCDVAEKANDLIFFVEDDYLFEIECIEEMIFTYSRISTLFKSDVFLCPSDYPFFYDSSYNTSIYVGMEYKWRIVKETLLTFMFSKNQLKNFRKNIRLVGEKINDPFEKPLHDIYSKEPCLSPIGSLSYHINRHVPATTENWTGLWQKNFKKIKV